MIWGMCCYWVYHIMVIIQGSPCVADTAITSGAQSLGQRLVWSSGTIVSPAWYRNMEGKNVWNNDRTWLNFNEWVLHSFTCFTSMILMIFQVSASYRLDTLVGCKLESKLARVPQLVPLGALPGSTSRPTTVLPWRWSETRNAFTIRQDISDMW